MFNVSSKFYDHETSVKIAKDGVRLNVKMENISLLTGLGL
jgi:hypothetical protein